MDSKEQFQAQGGEEEPEYIAEADAEEIVEIDEDEQAPIDDDDDDDLEDDGMEAAEDQDMDMEEETAADASAEPEAIEDNSSLTFRQHEGPVYAIALHPSGELVLSGGQDDRGILWTMASGEIVAVFDGHKDSVSEVGFSSDGKYAATGSLDGIIKIWQLDNKQQILDLDCGDDLTWLRWHPRGPFVLAGNTAGAVQMWHVPTGTMTYFTGHQDACACGEWAPNGKAFVSGGDDGVVSVWSPKTQAVTCKVDAKTQRGFHEAPVPVLAWHPDNVIVATGSPDTNVMLINTNTGKILKTFDNHTDNIESVAFSNSQPHMLATASLDGTANIYAVDTHRLLCTLQHEAGVIKVLWHSRIPVVYTACLDGGIRAWDARNGTLLHECLGHTNHVLDFDINADGDGVASASEDQTARVFRVENLPSV